MKTENRNAGKDPLILFFALVILVSAILEIGICLGGPDWLMLALMWTPGLAAILYVFANGRNTCKENTIG